MDAVISLLIDPRVIAIVAPVLVAVAKKGIAQLPKWALPVLSTVCGAVMSAVAGGDLVVGATAGLAGVGVREAVDQAVKRVAG